MNIELYKTANQIADKIKIEVNKNYSKEWPFLDDKEFKNIFSNFAIPSNTKCNDNCNKRCCPTACYFLSEKLDTCGIYEYRPVDCRLHFCKYIDNSSEDLKLLQILNDDLLNLKVGNTTFHSLTGKQNNEAQIIAKKFSRDELTSEEAEHLWKDIILEYRQIYKENKRQFMFKP